MRIYKYIYINILLLVIFGTIGCSSWIARTQKVVLLPEERIFTVPAGQTIAVELDGEPQEMTFPEDMKLVSSTVLTRQEIEKNEKVLKDAKASASKKKTISIIGSILTLGVFGLGIVFKMKSWFPKIKANVEVK